MEATTPLDAAGSKTKLRMPIRLPGASRFLSLKRHRPQQCWHPSDVFNLGTGMPIHFEASREKTGRTNFLGLPGTVLVLA